MFLATFAAKAADLHSTKLTFYQKDQLIILTKLLPSQSGLRLSWKLRLVTTHTHAHAHTHVCANTHMRAHTHTHTHNLPPERLLYKTRRKISFIDHGVIVITTLIHVISVYVSRNLANSFWINPLKIMIKTNMAQWMNNHNVPGMLLLPYLWYGRLSEWIFSKGSSWLSIAVG